MCPLSGLVQCLLLILIVLCIAQGVVSQAAEWNLEYSPLDDPIHMHTTKLVNFTLTSPENPDEHYLEIESQNVHIAEANKTIWLKAGNYTARKYSGSFSVRGNFLGQTQISFVVTDAFSTNVVLDERIHVVVIREERVIDRVFTASVATLVSVIYINFGCAIKWSEFREALKKPIGPALGFISQFAFMPTMSYLLGILLFPDNPEMQLGMFFTGVSPGGGASNIWTLILDGNIDLSITMTTVSTFAAFGMMPLWIFTLGRVIFDRGNLAVPYTQITTYAVALVVPLGIGWLMQRYLPKIAGFFAKILKIFGVLLILFIVIFAIVTNLYLFELFSWQIVVAGIGLPWLGYVFGYVFAWIFNRNAKDRMTIAIETGIQNTGIAIFLLRFALPQPQADLTTVAPVSVAIMTPVPLLALYIWRKLSVRCSCTKRHSLEIYSGVPFNTETDINCQLTRNSASENEGKPISVINVK